MATIHGKIAFGVRVKIKTPIAPSGELLTKVAALAESYVTTLITGALGGLRGAMPGVLGVEVSEAKTKLEVEKVEP